MSYQGGRIRAARDAGTRLVGDGLRREQRIKSTAEERPMEPIALSPTEAEELDHGARKARAVRAWRVEQLRRLGLPNVLATTFADLVDWHALAGLIDRGCPPELALEIVR
jgi:hypothetical protein